MHMHMHTGYHGLEGIYVRLWLQSKHMTSFIIFRATSL